MAVFRKARPQEPLIVSITGARIGDRLVGVIGRDPRLFLDAAAKVGITGRAYALAAGQADVARVQRAAVEHGVLTDVAPMAQPLPLPDESFDVALVDDRAERAQAHLSESLAPEIRRVLRPGGRVIVVVSAPTSLFAGLFGARAPEPDVSPLLRTLGAAGFVAARLVATHRGMAFVEAARRA